VGEEWRCRFEDVKKEKERKEGRGDHRYKLQKPVGIQRR